MPYRVIKVKQWYLIIVEFFSRYLQFRAGTSFRLFAGTVSVDGKFFISNSKLFLTA